MSFIRKNRPQTEESNLDRFRTKKKRWWLWITLSILIVVVGIVAWYAIPTFLAYKNATVTNSNKTSSVTLHQAAQAQDVGPINILLMGIEAPDHPGGDLSDSIMVASVDVKDKTVSLLSIPRDLYVSIPGHGMDKINTANSVGDQSGKGGGPALLEKTITQNFGIPIHYFVRLDFAGFQQLVDAVGGVTIDVPKAISDPYFPDAQTKGYDPFYISAGMHQMNGTLALKYARSRETTSDFDRSRRQQQLISAIKDKVLTPEILANPKKVTDIITILGQHILTDFSAGDANELVSLAKQMGQPTIRTQVLDNSDSLGLLADGHSSIGAYILTPRLGTSNFRAVTSFIQGYFATPAIQAEKPSIEIDNGGVTAATMTRVQQELEWAGFTVTTGDTPVETVKSSTLFDYSNGGKTHSLDFLKQHYGLSAEKTALPTGITSDMRLVVGPDWSTLESSQTAKESTATPTALPLSQLQTDQSVTTQ